MKIHTQIKKQKKNDNICLNFLGFPVDLSSQVKLQCLKKNIPGEGSPQAVRAISGPTCRTLCGAAYQPPACCKGSGDRLNDSDDDIS